MEKQKSLFEGYHGGKRANAGRKRKDPSKQLHIAREKFNSNQPLHIDIKLIKGLPSLRTKAKFQIIKQAIKKARIKGLKIIHFSIQKTHVHLLIEAAHQAELTRGMHSLCTSIAKSINSAINRTGSVFDDRYYLHVLRTLKEVKNALIYIFQNYAKHTKTPNRFDPYSTLICFPEIEKLGLNQVDTYSIFKNITEREKFKMQMEELIERPTTWHLNVGWKRAS